MKNKTLEFVFATLVLLIFILSVVTAVESNIKIGISYILLLMFTNVGTGTVVIYSIGLAIMYTGLGIVTTYMVSHYTNSKKRLIIYTVLIDLLVIVISALLKSISNEYNWLEIILEIIFILIGLAFTLFNEYKKTKRNIKSKQVKK
ncbi:MAG: hypothetical protein WCS56_02955 [Bacilli bacterium]